PLFFLLFVISLVFLCHFMFPFGLLLLLSRGLLSSDQGNGFLVRRV
ncbi:hypothetical protein CSUI_007049, partial [Cystoisospora suis]